MGSGGLGSEGGVSRSTGGTAIGSFSISSGGAGGKIELLHGPAPPKQKAIEKLAEILTSAKRGYLLDRFLSAHLRHALKAIVTFRIEVLTNRTWDWATKTYAIGPEAGCIVALVDAITQQAGDESTTEEQRSFTRQCLEDFFVAALGDNFERYWTLPASAAIPLLTRNQALFDHVLDRWLRSGIIQISSKGFAELPPDSRRRLADCAQQVAEKLCDQFRVRYLGKTVEGRAIHKMTDMLDAIASDPSLQDWFLREIRQP
jgi:hypothetical protein